LTSLFSGFKASAPPSAPEYDTCSLDSFTNYAFLYESEFLPGTDITLLALVDQSALEHADCGSSVLTSRPFS